MQIFSKLYRLITGFKKNNEMVADSKVDFPSEISLGKPEDIEQITKVINKSYKGDGGGWTDLKFIVEDIPRIDEDRVERYMQKPNSVFIKYTCEDETIGGCLFLEDIGDKKFHMWLMAVEPSKQNQGIGRKLLDASVNYARHNKYKLIEFTTTASRPEVVAWYERCGFTNTGKIIDFDLSIVLPTVKEKRIIREVEFVKYL